MSGEPASLRVPRPADPGRNYRGRGHHCGGCRRARSRQGYWNRKEDGDALVAELEGSKLARVVVVSNRVSVPSGDGVKRAGGLEVALRPALQHNGGVWFG